MTRLDYDQILEKYLLATRTDRLAIEKSYPKLRDDLRADAQVVNRLSQIGKSLSPTANSFRKTLSLSEIDNTRQNTNGNGWRLQPFGLAVGGMAVAVLVFGSIIVLRRSPATPTNTVANVAANGSLASTSSQISSDAQTEQDLVNVDDQPTTQLENQVNLASQHQTSLGEIYNAVAQ